MVGDYDPYDLRQNASALFPPAYYTKYLADPSVLKKIGAEAPYRECSDQVGRNFVPTGDVRDQFNGAIICLIGFLFNRMQGLCFLSSLKLLIHDLRC